MCTRSSVPRLIKPELNHYCDYREPRTGSFSRRQDNAVSERRSQFIQDDPRRGRFAAEATNGRIGRCELTTQVSELHDGDFQEIRLLTLYSFFFSNITPYLYKIGVSRCEICFLKHSNFESVVIKYLKQFQRKCLKFNTGKMKK